MSTIRHSNNKYTGLVIVATVVVILFACLIAYWVTQDSPDVEPIVYGNISHTMEIKAFFIRDEETLMIPADGYLISDIKEGERVANNQVIFSSVDQDSYSLVETIRQLDSEIFTTLISSSVNKNLFAEKDAILNGSITDSLKSMVAAVTKGSYDMLGIYTGNVNDALSDKYDTYINYGDTSIGEVNNLIAKRKSYQTSLNAHTTSVKAKDSCSISYNIYDNTKICEFDQISTLNASYLDNFKAKETTSQIDKLYKYGTSIARAVYGYEYYIAFTVTEEQYANMYYLKSYSVRLSNGTEIPCELVQYNDCRADNGKYTVILKTRYGLQDTIGLMYDQNAQLVIKDYEGFKVRLSSIFDYNSTTGEGYVYILSKIGAAEKRMVKVLAQDTYFAIIEEIPNKYDDSMVLYDEIIVNPSSVIEGQLVR